MLKLIDNNYTPFLEAKNPYTKYHPRKTAPQVVRPCLLNVRGLGLYIKIV